MQTVNFQCGSCSKLMAVGVDNLGQQVRCPHCQQVVIAPAAQAPAPTATEPVDNPFGDLRAHEDIFSTKSESDDPIFGQPDLPRLDFPRPEPIPTTSYESPPTELPALEREAPAPDLPASFGPETTFSSNSPEFTNEQTVPWSPAPAPQPPAAEEAPAFTPTPRPRRPVSGGFVSPMFLLLIFLPVLLWAIGATVMAFLLSAEKMRLNRQNDPFEAMPDLDGDVPGVRKGKAQTKGRLQISPEFATRKMPEHLTVKIGETIQMGDLEVTPTKVVREKARVYVETYEGAQPCEHDSLALYLKIKNQSDSYSFTPLDNYFDRYSKGKGIVPLTVLQAGERTAYGGPCKWYPILRSQAKRELREWLDGPGRMNVDRQGLAPGQEMKTFLATDGEDEKLAEHLFGSEDGRRKPYRGELLWRVHLRRGLYEHKGRKVPATCVIGVTFTDREYLGAEVQDG